MTATFQNPPRKLTFSDFHKIQDSHQSAEAPRSLILSLHADTTLGLELTNKHNGNVFFQNPCSAPTKYLDSPTDPTVTQSGLTPSKKRLALSILDFLSTSLKDGTLSSDDTESIEIASSCISECFKVDLSDKAALQDAVGGQSLFSIYGVYEKLKGKSTASTTGASSASEGRPSTPSMPKPDAKRATASTGSSTAAARATIPPNPDAEKLKSQGNAAMSHKKYPEAIDLYTQAITLSPTNPIYLSNRAAAYSASGDHSSAAADAELAVASDPKYTKAWSRLGLAKFALGDANGAAEAYQKGIEYEGSGGSEAMRKGLETAKKRVEEMEKEEEDLPNDEVDDRPSTTRAAPGGGMPDLSSLAGMFGGGGGGRGGGGMPDLSSIMSNPMFASMAQNLMSNPDMMNNLMNNPRLRQMAESFGGGGGGGGGGEDGAGRGGGGMPDLSSMMQDPNIAEM